MRPLQLFLPYLRTSLGDGAAARDAQRIYEAWGGESRVYLLPDLRKAHRWRDAHHHVGALAIPAECYDVVDVLHGDSTGHVVGPASEWLFPDGLKGFLSRVVVALDREGIRAESPPPPRFIRLMVPMVRKGRVVVRTGNAAFEWLEFPFKPGPLVPFSSVNRQTKRVTAKWPPPGMTVPSVAPETESEARYGPLEWGSVDGRRVAVATRDPAQKGLWMQLRFPELLERFFRSGAGLDDVAAVLHARGLRRRAVSDRGGALDRARAAAGLYVGTADAPAERLSFAHAEARGGLQAVWLLAQDWGLPVPRSPSAEALAGMRRSPEWQAALNRRETVVRAWSATGLLWALLLDELENELTLGTCPRCGREIQGTRRKRYCSLADNAQCFRARRAAAKVKERRRRRV